MQVCCFSMGKEELKHINTICIVHCTYGIMSQDFGVCSESHTLVKNINMHICKSVRHYTQYFLIASVLLFFLCFPLVQIMVCT